MTRLTKEQVEELAGFTPEAWQYRIKIDGAWSSWMLSEHYRSPSKAEEQRPLFLHPAAPDLHATCLALFAEVETLRNQAVLSRAEGEGLASMLLSVQQDCIAAVKEVDGLREALETYADPEIYRPHPHGIAFDRRDKSYIARHALKGLSDE